MLKNKGNLIKAFIVWLLVVALILMVPTVRLVHADTLNGSTQCAGAQTVSDCAVTCNTNNTSTSGTCAGCVSGGETNCVNQTSDNAASTCSSGSCDIIATIINPAISVLASIVGVVVVISIIIGGIQYSTSAGDPQKAAKARARIMHAIIALLAFGFLFGFLEFIIPGGAFQ